MMLGKGVCLIPFWPHIHVVRTTYQCGPGILVKHSHIKTLANDTIAFAYKNTPERY
jgi:hypothetical protein